MCNCKFCRNYHRYIWAVIAECDCCCHVDKKPIGHDIFCCEFPNGKRKDNPYKKLKSAKYYGDIIRKWEIECEKPLKLK
jgi:hypothetical protein